LGTCRIRKAPSGATIYIGYTSEIAWADNCHLTIVDHAILSKKPVLISAGDILMDGEHTYSDQHSAFNPVPVLTPHAVATLTGATVDVAFSASDSWVTDSTISSYSWSAPGTSATSGMSTATPTLTYNAAGNYRVECTVTAANGKTTTAVRFVMVFDATHKPFSAEIQAPSADYDSGGWAFNARMFADADPTDMSEGALCILFAEDWYGSSNQSIGQIQNRENIICAGYIAGESIEWDAEAGTVEFSVQGPQEWLKQISVNPFVLNFATAEPTTWEVMPALTVDRALWHILHWRSNATVLLNVTLTSDTRYAPKFESMDGSLWSQMDEIAWGKIFGRIGCDRYGRFYAVIDPQLTPEADRTWATLMTITKKDWSARINIKRTAQRKLAMLSMSGWVVDSSAAVSTLYSLAMGHVYAQYGDSEILDKLLAENQTQFNTLAGLYLGWKNNQLEFDITLSQNNRMIDLWPNQFLDVSLAAGDTPRGIAYAGNLIPRSITLQPDRDAGTWSTEISCEAETFAEIAVDGDIPASTGMDDWDSSFPEFPDMGDFPPFQDVYLPPSVTNANEPKKVIACTSD
jgi:PKD repeat protein